MIHRELTKHLSTCYWQTPPVCSEPQTPKAVGCVDITGLTSHGSRFPPSGLGSCFGNSVALIMFLTIAWKTTRVIVLYLVKQKALSRTKSKGSSGSYREKEDGEKDMKQKDRLNERKQRKRTQCSNYHEAKRKERDWVIHTHNVSNGPKHPQQL